MGHVCDWVGKTLFRLSASPYQNPVVISFPRLHAEDWPERRNEEITEINPHDVEENQEK
jgi:hypothetical protein